ncbi:hypothetical protein CEC48_02730 [Pseudomonas sp. K2I15]|nr:hypothetical protein CEC48_02730 [Pseudomonas sp. K2I15]
MTIEGAPTGDHSQGPCPTDQIGCPNCTFNEHFVDGFENIPDAFLPLFDGRNSGKLIVRVASAKSTDQ